jgi:hypothetical protein
VRFGGATASRQGSGALPPPRASARAWQPIGPKPATRRQARSRWRPDDRKVVRRRDRIAVGAKRPRAQNAPDSTVISRSNAGGFPTADRRAVSKGDVSTWVLVTRNVGCRNGFEASWRCVQGKAVRPHEAQGRAMDEIDVPDGARRPSSSQKGARAGKGRKIGARPSVTGPALTVWPVIEPKSRIRGRCVGS